MMTIYTQEDWRRDRTFSAKPGQQIEEAIYWEMFNVLPPLPLPRREETNGYYGGFCVSEPIDHDARGRPTYSAYAQKNGNYYYLGDFPLND